jgi:hypothetical protein
LKKIHYFSSDILEFLYLLSRHAVRYLIVGGEAVIYYGHARLTGDIDLFYETNTGNAQNLFSAFKDFWDGDIPEVESADELLNRGVNGVNKMFGLKEIEILSPQSWIEDKA